MKLRAAVAVMALILCGGAVPRAQETDGVRLLLLRVERIVQEGDTAAYFASLSGTADRNRARDFASFELQPGATRAVVRERDRESLSGTLPGNGYRLMVDVLAEFGSRARIATWRLDVRRTGQAGTDGEWTILDEEKLSSVDNIYRIGLNTTKAYAARNLQITTEDLELALPEGSLFVADIDVGVTAVVLLGKGAMHFHPAPATERGQVKMSCGSETLDTAFDAAFIRINPSDFTDLFPAAALQPKALDAREVRRAQELFRDESQKSFGIDLGDLSRDAWSLLPSAC